MPAHYYQTVEMAQAVALHDLMDNVPAPAGASGVIHLWANADDQQKTYESVVALKQIYDTVTAATDAALAYYQLQHDPARMQEIMQSYYQYSQSQVEMNNGFIKLTQCIGPQSVIPYDQNAVPVACIEFMDLENVPRAVYVFMGAWLTAQFRVGEYGYLVGNLPAGTKITYGNTTYVI